MKTIKCFHLAVLFLAFGVVACSEDDSPNADAEIDVETAQEVVNAQMMFSDIYTVSTQAINDSEVRENELCGSVSLDTMAQTVIIDFGEGCTGPWGVTRSGKMTISYQGIPYTVGSAWSVSLDNYRVNEITLNGVVSIDNVTNENDVYSFTYKVTNGKLDKEDGESYTYDANHVYKWVAGINTFFNNEDDEWEITGTSAGTTSKGQGYSASTSSALLGKQACLNDGEAYISSGSLQITVPALELPMDVDFGDGSCDTEAVVNYNGFTKAISLR